MDDGWMVDGQIVDGWWMVGWMDGGYCWSVSSQIRKRG